MEIWKDIPGYEEYQVSDLGNVKSKNWRNTKQEKVLTPKRQNRGYLQVELVNATGKKTFLIHRLVANAFLDPIAGCNAVNHKDEDKRNNSVGNLEWCTNSQNMAAYIRNHKSTKPVTRIEPIEQRSLSGSLIRIWDNANALKRETGYHPTSIWKCCEGHQKQAYGYKWQYAISNNNE